MASRRAWATLVACEMLPILLPGTLGSCVPSMIYFDLFWIRSHSPHNLEVRTVHMEAARAALAQHRAAKFAHHPPAGPTPHDGMRPRARTRRHTSVPGSKIGSISQATKVAQAIRDARH